MKITIESTTALVQLDIDGKTVPARLWEGTTESGTPVACFITRISPQTHDEAANAQFARELQECREPGFDQFKRGIDLRYFIG